MKRYVFAAMYKWYLSGSLAYRNFKEKKNIHQS